MSTNSSSTIEHVQLRGSAVSATIITWESDQMRATPKIVSDRAVSVYPDSKVHGANMGPTWVLSAPDGLHVGPMNHAFRVTKWVRISSPFSFIGCAYLVKITSAISLWKMQIFYNMLKCFQNVINLRTIKGTGLQWDVFDKSLSLCLFCFTLSIYSWVAPWKIPKVVSRWMSQLTSIGFSTGQ